MSELKAPTPNIDVLEDSRAAPFVAGYGTAESLALTKRPMTA
jgi:hypothetical protein